LVDRAVMDWPGLVLRLWRACQGILSLRLRPFLQTRRGLDGRWSAAGWMVNGSGPMLPRWQVLQVTRHAGARDPDDVVGIDLFSHGVHEARNFLQCLGILCQCGARWTVCCDDAGSSAWQAPHRTPSSPFHCFMMSWTCCPVRFLGSTLRFVGAG